VQGAMLATKYSEKIASHLNISKYIVSFVIVAFITILPETLIAINAAIEGIPEFGLGSLFGTNIAELTLIFAILIFVSRRSLKIESKILKDIQFYPFILMLPVVFGFNGYYSRFEGIILLIAGFSFYYFIFKNSEKSPSETRNNKDTFKSISAFLFGMVLLLVGAHFTVTSATSLAKALNINPILIGLLVVSLGTTIPELFYSLKAIKKHEDGLAIGDILGSVLADATIVVGIIAIISPFKFPVRIVSTTGVYMVISSFILLHFMRTGKTLTKKEGFVLVALWITYAILELIINV
jgi:cation:H+ antiporter